MIKTELLKPTPRSVLSTVLVVVLGSCIVICGIAVAYTIERYRLFKISQTIQHGREEIVSLKVTEQTVGELESQIAQTDRQWDAIDTLRSYHIPVYSIITEVERSKPRAAQLQLLSARPPEIELIGTVPLNRIAVDFVRQLKNSSMFSEAELVELKAMTGFFGLEFKIVVRVASQP